MAKKPTSQRDILEHIWFAIEGTNGDDGMKHDLRENNKETKELRKDFGDFLLHREDTCPVKKREEWDWKKKMAYFMLQVSVMGFIISTIGIIAKAVGLW